MSNVRFHIVRFRLGPPPNSLSDAELDSGQWQRVPFPPLWAIRLLAIPVGALTAFLLLLAWARFTPHFEVSFAPFPKILVALILIGVVGIAIQVSASPGLGLTENSIVGFWPSRMLPYTSYLLKQKASHFVAALSLPFVALAFLPLLVFSALHVSSGWVIFVSCFSAASFGLNVFLAVWLVIRLPNGSFIAGRGFQPYWRLPQ